MSHSEQVALSAETAAVDRHLNQARPNAEERQRRIELYRSLDALLGRDLVTERRAALNTVITELGESGFVGNQPFLRFRLDADGREAIRIFIQALRDPDEDMRGAIVRSLGDFGPKARQAIPALIDCLKDDEPDVSAAAAAALGNISCDLHVVIPALMKALQDDRREVRTTAVNALAFIGKDDAIPSLIRLLQHRDAKTRANAAGALGLFEKRAKSAVPDLIELVKDQDADVRNAAVSALGSIGDAEASMAILVGALKDEKARWNAIWALGMLGKRAKSACPALAVLIGEHELQALLAFALVRMESDSKEVIIAINAALQDNKCKAPLLLCEALSRIGGPTEFALPGLIQRVSTYWPIKGWEYEFRPYGTDFTLFGDGASGALRKIGAPAVPKLIESLNDKDESNRMWSAMTLGNIGTKAKASLKQLLELGRDEKQPDSVRSACLRAAAQIAPYDKSVVKGLLHGLDDPKTQTACLEAVSQMGPNAKPLLPSVIKLLAKPGQSWQANEYLLPLGDHGKETWPKLVEMYRDKPLELAKLYRTMGRTDDAVACLTDIINKELDQERDAERLLGELGKTANKAVPALRDRFERLSKKLKVGQNCLYRIYTAKAIWDISQDVSAVKFIASELKSKSLGAGMAALYTLKELGPVAKHGLKELLELIGDNPTGENPDLCEIFASLGADGKPAGKKLAKMLQDEHVGTRLLAAEMLGLIGPSMRDEVPVLLKAIEDEYPLVRRAAEEALRKIDAAAAKRAGIEVDE